MTDAVRVVFSVDMEEEGLFSGSYAAAPAVRNVAALERLAFVTEEFGLPLTLLCTWPVLRDADCAALLRRWRDERGAEIGLHLHPWSTPPFADAVHKGVPSAAQFPLELLDAKLAHLAEAAAEMAGRPAASFRMGRFDLTPPLRPLLPRHGIRADSSLVPLRFVPGMPEAFLSPADPHPLEGAGGAVTEIPLTVAPVVPGTPGLAWRLAGALPRPWGHALLSGFRKVAAAGVQPVWYPLESMRLAARLHLARGGRVLHLFLHSSELAPGFAPHLPDQSAVDRVLRRILLFLRWLARRGPLRGATMSDLAPGGRP